MSTTAVDPRRYFESVAEGRGARSEALPVCLYLEVTNRCNLLCETCPRTFEALEPPADMSYELFRRIIDQVPRLQRAVLHGVGEPMLVGDLPRMIGTLKERGVYVLFNTNGTLLSPRQREWLIGSGLDELRISLDAADPVSFRKVRGRDFFRRIVRNVAAFVDFQKRSGAVTPAVSLWLTGLRETIAELPRLVELAATMGVREVYLQRLVFDETGRGLATPDQALFDRLRSEDEAAIVSAQELAAKLGVRLDASGATEPGLSLK
ncbi:MAG: radical SAM protein, partial [Acetobacteraceae bacterium]